jgi:hypothetical protein
VIGNWNGTTTITVEATGSGLSYQWRRWNGALSNSGVYSGVNTPTLTISPTTLDTMSQYSVSITNACGTIESPTIRLHVPCGVNCDGSSGSPALTPNDFQCFADAYAAGLSYANCDGSTVVPTLTANDFQCWFNKFMTQDCSPW